MKKLPQFELSNEGCIHSINLNFHSKPEYWIDINPKQMAFELMSSFNTIYFTEKVAYTFDEMPLSERKSIAIKVLNRRIEEACETLIVFSKFIDDELIEYTQKGYYEATKQEIEKL